MIELRLYLFGAPRLERDGVELALHRSRGLALLAYLATTCQPHTRDALTALLWPDFDPAGARNNLRRELSLLKGVLGEGILAVQRDRIGFNPEPPDGERLWVDVNRFESEVEDTLHHEHAHADHCLSCARVLEAATALFTAEFLAGFSLPDAPEFDEWQFYERERLRGLFAGALQRLATGYAAREEFGKAIEANRRRVALDPLDEPAQRDLMRTLAASGQASLSERQYERLAQLLKAELGQEPAVDTTRLLEAIRAQRALPSETPITPPLPVPRPTATIPSNLPADTTPFIGRAAELAQLGQLLANPDVRMLTILGIGGMGKTRVGLAAASQLASSEAGTAIAPNGIFFVPLAPVVTVEDIMPTLAHSLGISLAEEVGPRRQLIEHLKPQRALLFLDNIEHLIAPESTDLLHDILNQAPGVKLLLTSRARLGLRGEYAFPLSGLEVPDPVARESGESALSRAISEGNAVALFAEAARRAQPSFQLNGTNIQSVLGICKLVQGMPLAIELAAGWIELLPPQAILAEIESGLDFLESDYDHHPGQGSLRAVFESSWRLLTTAEQEVLARLTVFLGGFTRDAAEQVAGASLRTLLSLANKSWLQPVGGGRYQLHELLRQYAAQMPDVAADSGALREQHALYFATYLAELDRQMTGRRPDIAFDAVSADIENVRAAVSWLVGADRIPILTRKMLLPLFRYIESRFRYFLFYPMLAAAATRAGELGMAREQAIIITLRMAFFFEGFPTRLLDYSWVEPAFLELTRTAWEQLAADPTQGDFWSILFAWQYGRYINLEKGAQRLRALQALCDFDTHRWEAAFARQSLGRLLSSRNIGDDRPGRAEEALECLRSALSLFDALGDVREAAITRLFLGYQRQDAGDLDDAKRTMLEAQQHLYALGEDLTATASNWRLAEVHMEAGETQAALDYLHKMSATLLTSGSPQLAAISLSRASYETARYGNLEEAIQLRERSLALSRQYGSVFNEGWDSWEMGEILRIMGRLSEARQWFERSRALFESIESTAGTSFYYRGLGAIALAVGDHAHARSNFELAATWAERTHHQWQLAYAVTGLGRAALAAGLPDDARSHFARALPLVSGAESSGGLIFMVITGAVQLFQATDNAGRACELAELVLTHPLSWYETRVQAGQLLGLTSDELAEWPRGGLIDLAPIVAQLADELRELGYNQPS